MLIPFFNGNQHSTPGAALQGAQWVVVIEGNGKNQGLLLEEVTHTSGTRPLDSAYGNIYIYIFIYLQCVRGAIQLLPFYR